MTGFLRTWCPLLGVSASLTGALSAEERESSSPTRTIILVAQEPKTGVEPKTPKVDPKVDPKTPKVDPKVDPPTPPATDLLAGTGDQSSRTSGSASFAPNMFGDVFGGRGSQINAVLGRLSVQSFTFDSFGGRINLGAPLSRSYPLPSNFGGIAAFGDSRQAGMLGVPPGGPLAVFPNATPGFTSVQNAGVILGQLSGGSGGGSGNGPPPPPVPFAITDNAQYRAVANALFQKLYGPAGATLFSAANSEGVLFPAPVAEAPAGVGLNYEYARITQINLPSPGSGGVVGRTKIAEDNNPLPRDRFIFNYDFFSNTPLTAGGFDVHRFAPGIEKTFLDQQASIEIRVPFASTLNPVGSMDGISSRDAVIGNIYTTLKYLAYSSQTLNVATGLGVSIPTSPDLVVNGMNGSEFLRVKNESLAFVPYLAFIYTPTREFFWQNWISLSMDSTGSPVLANLDGTGSKPLGRFRDQSVLALDTHLGYWLITPGSGDGFIQGLAPFIELHYNTSISNGGQIFSNGFVFATGDNRYDELNMATGVAMYLDRNLLVSGSLSLPLKTGGDRFFDYQLGLRMSWFFGPSAANRQGLQFGF